MSTQTPPCLDDPPGPPPAPGWLVSGRGEDPEALAFRSGAALAVLHPWIATADGGVPLALLRDRRALAAAAACAGFAGRPERTAELRDEIHLARPGDRPGPAGEIFLLWRQAVRQPLRGDGLARLRDGLALAEATLPVALRHADPVAAAAATLGAILAAHPQREAPALILADAVLARALGWDRPVPLLATGLACRDLALRDEALRLACHRAVAAAALEVARAADDLTRRAARLRAVAPKLRARAAQAAVQLFLAEDALSPGIALSPRIRGSSQPMTDRAARRLCDRLVALGAVRELTGRGSFRLYGL